LVKNQQNPKTEKNPQETQKEGKEKVKKKEEIFPHTPFIEEK